MLCLTYEIDLKRRICLVNVQVLQYQHNSPQKETLLTFFFIILFENFLIWFLRSDVFCLMFKSSIMFPKMLEPFPSPLGVVYFF